MTTTTIVTTSARRRRRSSTVGHEAPHDHSRRGVGASMGILHAPPQEYYGADSTTTVSHRHYYSPFSGSARYSRPTFSIESGWVEEALDGKAYVGRDTIEELEHDSNEQHDNNIHHAYDGDDDDDYNYNYEDEDDDDDDLYDNNDDNRDDKEEGTDNNEMANMKKNLNTRQSLSTASGDVGSGVRRNTFGIPIIKHPLSPPISPPPPLPRKQSSPCPPSHSILSSHRSKQSIDAPMQKRSAGPSKVALNGKTSSTTRQSQQQTQTQTEQPQAQLDTQTEIALLQDNFTLLRTVSEDLKIMVTWFFAQRPVEAFDDHVSTCGVIEDNVQLILESLTRRRRLGEEEWSVRSPGWHEKYTNRMYSLHRTLHRLLDIRPAIEERVLKQHQIVHVLGKLREYQDKMVDLAQKFQASFDRLRVRHIHFLLTQAYSQASQRREGGGRIDQASFERQWFEDKAVRADLRREFFAAQRTSRHKPSPHP